MIDYIYALDLVAESLEFLFSPSQNGIGVASFPRTAHVCDHLHLFPLIG